MRNSKLITAWALGVLARADRPEIKNDADEMITSPFDSTETVAGFSLMNSTRDTAPYAQWMTFPGWWDNPHDILFSNDMADPDRTFHAFKQLSDEYGDPDSAAEASDKHVPFKGAISLFLRVLDSTTKNEPTLELEPLYARHGKYLVLADDVDDFLKVNHDLLHDPIQRTIGDDHLFLYGYVLGPHEIIAGSSYYFHTYYVYAPRSDASEAAWRHVTRTPLIRETVGDQTPATLWEVYKLRWIKLPDTLNWQSVLLKSSLNDGTITHVTQELSPDPADKSTFRAAVWTTCMEPIALDEHSMGIQTHIIGGTPVNLEHPSPAFYRLQIFDSPDHHTKPTDAMLEKKKTTCRYQKLILTASGKTGKQTSDETENPILIPDDDLVPQTTMSLDVTDLLFHQEYDMPAGESDIFVEATKQLFTSPHFKQSLLFETSGIPLKGRTTKHLYLVFETAEKYFDHSNSAELKAFFDSRNNFGWSKRTDLVNMASPLLQLQDKGKPSRMSKVAKLALQVASCGSDMKKWMISWPKEFKNLGDAEVEKTEEYAKVEKAIGKIDFTDAEERLEKLELAQTKRKASREAKTNE